MVGNHVIRKVKGARKKIGNGVRATRNEDNTGAQLGTSGKESKVSEEEGGRASSCC
jgi:hypothetical protein